ncbi:MAG: hypothetical protein CSA81_13600 [Acidobacteria bacterium]|nr:MAG: hypothetical protein CSA81_13600 [Acidobacteriota bacterium]
MKKKAIATIVFFFLGLFFILPFNALAENTCPEEGLEGVDFLLFHGPLVPCGVNNSCPGQFGNDIQKTCTICHLFILLKNLLDLMTSLLIIVSLFMITIGGVIYIISAGNAKMVGIAKGLITKTLTGFLIFLLAWLIIFTVLKFLSFKFGAVEGGKWWTIECDTESAFGDLEVSENDNDPNAPSGETPSAPPGGTRPGDPDSPYTYDNNSIKNQQADASEELKDLLDCMNDKLPAPAKRISSISDNAGMDRCVNNYSKPPCHHARYSCHYGGRNCRGRSHAVDFGDERYAHEIIKAANECGGQTIYGTRGHHDHVHVSIGGARCGCK